MYSYPFASNQYNGHFPQQSYPGMQTYRTNSTQNTKTTQQSQQMFNMQGIQPFQEDYGQDQQDNDMDDDENDDDGSNRASNVIIFDDELQQRVKDRVDGLKNKISMLQHHFECYFPSLTSTNKIVCEFFLSA